MGDSKLESPFLPQNPFSCDWLGNKENISSISRKVEKWEDELKCDSDRKFLLEGIRQGFRITDEHCVLRTAEGDNHRSAIQHNDAVEKELLKQIAAGNYVLASEKPTIVSPLAAIEKDDGDIRLIHDGSRPMGCAMNDYASVQHEHFQTIEDACSLAKPGYWMAKLDLKSAYRSVPVHRDDYRVTGLKWRFKGERAPTYLFDTRLPFGASKAPSHFHRLSQAIGRCLRRRGIKGVVVYIDDFLLIAPTREECNNALHCLINLVRRFGFHISWNKVVGPTQRITFLGIEIDTRDCTLSLGEQKLAKVHQQLDEFSKKRRASKQQLQRLAGLLNWACQGIRGGKFFLRRILDAIKPLRQQNHKTKLSSEFHKDVQWWLAYLCTFNGVIYYNRGETHHVHVDACGKACGVFCRGDWQYSVFHVDTPAASELHINYKELCAAIQGIERWAQTWTNSVVIVHTDNSVTKAIINKGRSRNPYMNCLLRKLFWLSTKHNFSVRAIHVPGLVNTLPDTISRLHEAGNWEKLCVLLRNWSHRAECVSSDLSKHMSKDSFVFLVQERQRRLKKN